MNYCESINCTSTGRNFLDCYAVLGAAVYPTNEFHEEEEDMSYDGFNDQDTNARQYIEGRLMVIYHNKSGALQKDFGLVDDERPTTAKELIARITEGKFQVSEDKMERDSYSPIDYFRWRDPSVKEDKAGYDTAINTMKAAKTEVEDTIMVGTPSDALTALKAFEGKTFH